MKFTRAIALCALTLAIALAIGAISPLEPFASAGSIQPIFSDSPAHVQPTPALPTAAPVVEQLPAAPVVEQLPAPTPQVIYIQLPAAPPPQVIYIQPAAPVEQPPAAEVEQPPAAPVEQPPAAPDAAPACAPGVQNQYCDLPVLKLTNNPEPPADQALSDYQQRQRQYSGKRTR